MHYAGALHLRVQRGHRGRNRLHRGRHDPGTSRSVGLQEDEAALRISRAHSESSAETTERRRKCRQHRATGMQQNSLKTVGGKIDLDAFRSCNCTRRFHRLLVYYSTSTFQVRMAEPAI